ncbi:MAG: L-rhamnose isomerase [Clostridiales bacterium]|nr:L-rhamnose isomerase [Clostridiales bacterium]
MNIFEYAKSKYDVLGIDVEAAIRTLSSKEISIHCWQGDDVVGFEQGGQEASGGIQATGNYPGRARTPEELMADFEVAIKHIPGKKRINLHASYAVHGDIFADRDELEYKHFAPWVEFAKKNDLGIDFNPTFFSHPMVKDGLTLSSPDNGVRAFWIRHARCCRKISAQIAKELGKDVLHNIWIPDGFKDIPGDKLGPRRRLKESLDIILADKYDGVIDSLESKVFGIGVESYTVGSNEFYLGYAASRKGVYNLLDNGHYHPTESVADKISSLLLYFDKIPLHVTRPVRWDSDHVVTLNDDVLDMAKEIVRCDALDKVLIGLDFFDASINRIAAWIIGTRNMQKALLQALLLPNKTFKELQDSSRFTELLMLNEAVKTLPFGVIWEEYCRRSGVSCDTGWYSNIAEYERNVLSKRG